MESKILGVLCLSILALVLCMSLGSAAVTLTPVSVPQTAIHNSAVTVTFDLTADTQGYTSLDWLASTTDVGISWSSLPSSTTLSIDETKTFSAILSVPKHTSGTFNAKINVVASPDSHSDDLPLTITINDSSEISVSDSDFNSGDTTTITVTNEGNTDLTGITLSTSASDDFAVSYGTTPFSLNAGITQDIEVTMTTDPDTLDLGTNTVTLTASADQVLDVSTSGKLTYLKSYCDDSNEASLDVEIKDIEIEEGFGSDNDYAYPFDEIKVEVKLDNRGSYDLEDIAIKACLLDKEDKECIFDEDDMDISDDDFDLDQGDDVTIYLTFLADADDFTAGNNDYSFYVKATGEIDDSDKGEYHEKDSCHSDNQDIEIRTDETFVLLRDFQFIETAKCGDEVQISVEAWNIGDEEIKDDEVFVRVYDKDLGINKVIELTRDINELDYEMLDFIIDIPHDVEEGKYTLEFSVYDDEDMGDNDIYENSEEDEAIYSVSLNVEGDCAVSGVSASVSASLESEAKAGKELIIKATVTNTGEEETATYILNAAGYTEWASIAELSMTTLTLTAGQSADILVTFDVNKDAEGENSFNFEILSEGQLVVTQPVSVSIEKSGWGITGGIIGDNPYIWGIGLFNIILIIVIVIVAVRLARK